MKEIENNSLRLTDKDKEVTLYGWVQKKRDLGGVCFIICGCLNDVFGWDMPLWKQQLIASVIITGLEFMTGVVVNIIL